jgi:spore germination protein YaaH
MKYILIVLFAMTTMAQSTQEATTQFKKARRQFVLEYTVFGVDQCLKQSNIKFVTKSSESKNDEVVIGTPAYFSYLAKCFKTLPNLCPGENCVVSKSMKKRIENVDHLDNLISKYDSNDYQKEKQKRIIQQQITTMNNIRTSRKVASKVNQFLINTDFEGSVVIEDISSDIETDSLPEEIIEVSSTQNSYRKKVANLRIFKTDEDENESQQSVSYAVPRHIFN